MKNKITALIVCLHQKQMLKDYKAEVYEYNFHVSGIVALTGLIISCILFFLSLPFIGILKLTTAYAIMVAFFGVFFILHKFFLKIRCDFVRPFYYVLMISMDVLSIIMGTVLSTNTNATTFLFFLFLLPVLIIDTPWRLILLNIIISVAFCITVGFYKTGILLSLDIANTISICCLSIIFIAVTIRGNLHNFENTRKQKSEVKNRDYLINAIPVGIAKYEIRNGIVKQTFTNESFYHLFEDTPEARSQRNGGSFIENIHPDDRADLMKVISSVINGETDHTVSICRSKKGDGSYLWVRFASSVTKREKDYIEVYSTYTSVENEIRSKEKEQEKAIMMSSLLNQIPGGVIIYRFGIDNISIDYFSDGIPKMTGHTSEEFSKLNYSDCIFKEDTERFIESVMDSVRKKQSFQCIYRLRHKDGSLIWCQMSANLIREENGELIYYAVFTKPLEEENLYRSIVEDSSSGVLVATRQGRRILYMNMQTVLMFGGTEEALKRRLGNSSTIPKGYALLTDEETRTLSENEYSDFHVVWKNKHLSVNAKAIIWNGMDAYVCYISDETPDYMNQIKLQNLLDSVPSGIAIYQINGTDIKQTFVNRSFYQIVGTTEDEYKKIIDDNLFMRVYSQDVKKMYSEAKKLTDGSDYCDFIYRTVDKHNNLKWIRLTGNVYKRTETGFYLYACHADVTERIEAQKDVEAKRQEAIVERNKQKTLFDTVPSGILEFFFDGKELKVISANHTLINMIGYEEEEFAKKTNWDLAEIVHKDDLIKLHEAADSVEIGKGKSYDFRLFNKKTQVYRWISCDYNITKRTEDGIVVLSAFLDIDDKRKLESASEAKSRFLSRMSHDMRTPMNGIIGMTKIMEEMPDLSEEVRENLKAISDSGSFLLGLINDTLEMSRIESGKIELHSEVIRADELVNNIIKTVMPMAKKKNITIECIPINAELEYIRVDRLRIQQVYMNVLSNAIKFTPDGGRVRIEIECLKRENGIAYDRISIEDNGIGMNEEFIEHIFEPFSQENEYSGTGMVGTGLGLSIVKQLVDMMGGKIKIESKKNVGTKVTVFLNFERVYNYEEIEKTQKPIIPQNILCGKRILMVEDHPINAKITKKHLEKMGAIVTHAENGQIAVKLFNESPINFYAAILMDIRMPVMDGTEATKIIRALQRQDAKSIPIIAATANAYDIDMEETKKAGMNAHLSKPIEPETLYLELSKLM